MKWLRKLLGLSSAHEPGCQDNCDEERRRYLHEMLDFDTERLKRIEVETQLMERPHGEHS